MKVCARTGYPVEVSTNNDYAYYCPALDEDLYEFEVIDAPVPLEYDSFKGRKIKQSDPVLVYKNLHNGKLSIRQGNYVVAHVDSVILKGVEFVVREAGRQQVLKERRKNVHAFVKGYVVATNTGNQDTTPKRISYDPYKFGYFYDVETEEPAEINRDDILLCNASNGLFIL